MLVLGLTGPSGAGKGVVGEVFRAKRIPVLDTDKVYHLLIGGPSRCTEELKMAFGDAVISTNGGIDRRALAKIVFSGDAEEKEKKEKLNRITHRYVIAVCEDWLSEQKNKGVCAAVIDAPLLIESELHLRCDYVIAVLASREVRLARIMMRDGLAYEAANARLSAQPEDAFYREHAQFVFCNDKTTAEARSFVTNLLTSLSLV